MKALDPWAVELEGTSLIEASAGTGKTYTLTTLWLRLLVEHDLTPDEILVVTYTQAATAELRERIRERLQAAIAAVDEAVSGRVEEAPAAGSDEANLLRLAAQARARAAETGRPDPLREALGRFDEAAIFTIHGFCQRTLQENAFESGLPFDAELVQRSEPIERTLVHDLFRRLISDQDESFIEWLRVGEGRRWGIDPDALYDQLLRLLGADDEMPVVPLSASPSADEALLVQEAAAAFRAWARVWRGEGEKIAARLISAEGLSRSSYAVKSIESTWLPGFDALAKGIEALEGDDARVSVLSLPKGFEKLTSESLVAGTKKGFDPPEIPGQSAFADVIEALEALRANRDRRALALRQRFVVLAREEAARRRDEKHLLFFDDLLSELRRALEGMGGTQLRQRLRARHRFALIDEFQDTDPVQYDVFRRLWHDSEPEDPEVSNGLILIGDPKQAIYGFRGADVFTYLSAHAAAGERVHGLATNWRSDPGVIHAVNALFEGVDHAFRLEEIGFDPVGVRPDFDSKFAPARHGEAGLRVLFGNRDALRLAAGEELDEKNAQKKLPIRLGRTLLMDAVAADIVALLESGATLDGRPVAPSDIAILCRRKKELQQARRALERVGVPCVDRGDEDVFETREAWELACVLWAMIRPADPARVRAALATGAHGFTASEVAALGDDSMALADWSERYADWGRRWQQSGFGSAFEAWRRGAEAMPRLLGARDGERRATNWMHLGELLQRFDNERRPPRAGLLEALERAIGGGESRAAFGADASLLRLERDDQAVQLVTLHRSKGLEYPFVYLPSLWEDWSSGLPGLDSVDEGKSVKPVRYHDATLARRTLDLAGHEEYASHVHQHVEETFSEQLRLLYVGLTRARHQCVVTWAAMEKAPGTPMAWLLDTGNADLPRKKSQEGRKEWSDEDWRSAWGRLAQRARERGGAEVVSIEEARLKSPAVWMPPAEQAPELDFVERSRTFPRSLRTTSFSALTREGHRLERTPSDPELEGRDLDSGSPSMIADGDPQPEGGDAEAASDLAADMHVFPRGAGAGTLLHDMLEKTDFAAVLSGSVSREDELARAEHLLGRNGMERSWADQVLHVVESVARTPLFLHPEHADFRLGDVKPGALRPEVEFTLVAPGQSENVALDPAALSALLAQAPPGSPLARYAERAGGLGFRPLTGFLRGFIDVVFHDGERYFLIDYKSNHLGARQADYAPERLVESMLSHDYVLQYLLYSVALDRHLSVRLADYDYDRHFGGAYYLFLRGFAPDHAPGTGVFHDRPSREIVRALSEALGGTSGEGGGA